MAWYLSEVVTDLSPVGDILKLYDQTGSFPEDVFDDEYKKRLVPLLRQATFNTDHIQTDTIPAAYENDEYKWLASGYHENNKTIAIGTHKDPYKVPLNLDQLSIYLQYIIPNSKRELKEIFGKFKLDSASRRIQLNTIDFKTDAGERMNLQNINKGLTMELFASGMFGYFDHPSEVHSNCLVNRYQPQGEVDDSQYLAVPNNFAQGGVPDVQVDYTNFMVILEVSAKSKTTSEHFRSQLRFI